MTILKHIIISLVLLFSISNNIKANNSKDFENRFDSIEISLLTCEPHTKAYSMYGHTAIRINDKTTGEDLAVNYGVFDSRKKNFVLRFIFGLTDYEIGVYPFSVFCQEYLRDGRYVKEQILNLTNEEKQKIVQTIAINSLPENKQYRYNIFYNNCTTKAFNVITENIDGEIVFRNEHSNTSFRKLVHKYTRNYPWNNFGIDILLGVKADKKITFEESLFLPEELMLALDNATKKTKGMKSGALALSKNTLIESNVDKANKPNPLRPICVLTLVSLLILAVSAIEIAKKRYFGILDMVLFAILGLIGILLAIMIFSQHPTVRINLQILLFNPLMIIFGWKAIRKRINYDFYWFWTMSVAMLLLFLLGNIFQNYAEGTNILALSLLIRYISISTQIGKNNLKNKIKS